jgi:hypothetical protein
VEEVVIIAFVLLAVFAVGAIYRQRTSMRRLRASFGPEYRRLEADGESPRSIRRELMDREHRVAKLHLVPLGSEQKNQYVDRWKSIQARFVDEPRVAVTDAEHLLEEVMRARGYPEANHQRRIADLSVHHAHVLDDYREASEIAARHRERQTSTEDLRRAMVLYRSLFEDVLER